MPSRRPTVEAPPRTDSARRTHRAGNTTVPLQLPVSERRLLLMLGDAAAALGAVYIALRVWANVAHVTVTSAFIEAHAYWFIIVPIPWLILANANDCYNLRVAARASSSLLRLAWVTIQLLVLYVATFFAAPRGLLPRRFILYYAVCTLVFAGLWRGCRIFLIGWTGFRRRAIVVGSGQPAELIRQALVEEAAADYEVVGTVISAHDAARPTSLPDVIGTGQDLPDLVRRHGVSEVVMAYINEVPDDVFAGVMACYEQGVTVMPMPVLYEQITGRVPIEHVGERLWALVLPHEGRSRLFSAYEVIKRGLDIAFALVGLMLFALLLPVLALVIVLDSRGPVFYRQERIGRAGHVFRIVKLRTMITGAEAVTGPQWAQAGDPRVTRVGRLLRKTRLDEVPQLLNVLRGEMSLIGPRPERPAFIAMLAAEIPFYRTRLAVKPGLTGWAQVRYRYGSSTEDALRKLQYDMYYIRHQSLALDLSIMLKTVGTVFLLRGT